MDEDTRKERLDFLLSQHEYFHQGMAVADCESVLFRDESRGLEGGAFFTATLLNRKETLTAKGKNAMDEFKDLYLLKSEARFIQYFFHKFETDPVHDNTPDSIRTASLKIKKDYLHGLVSDCLKDLLPFFKQSNISAEPSSQLLDHPLQKGRATSLPSTSPPLFAEKETLDEAAVISVGVVDATASVVISSPSETKHPDDYLNKSSVLVSKSRMKTVFSCQICQFESRYETVCLSHIKVCMKNPRQSEDDFIEKAHEVEEAGEEENPDEVTLDHEQDDFYFNYKNGEFLIDSIFAIMTIFEKFGDGVGCLIVSKILLPIFHGLNHNNYTCTIHRFISRILCEANPREGLKLVHERFSNRVGKPGKNVFRDRRMEFRIGITKKLIENLGPNFSDQSVMQVNHCVDIKEKLYIHTRLSHGVNIRSGRHVPRSDECDFKALVENLTATKAHLKIEGRKFGSFEYPENLIDDEMFDQAKFYHWIAKKNGEGREIIEAKKFV